MKSELEDTRQLANAELETCSAESEVDDKIGAIRNSSKLKRKVGIGRQGSQSQCKNLD